MERVKIQLASLAFIVSLSAHLRTKVIQEISHGDPEDATTDTHPLPEAPSPNRMQENELSTTSEN